MPVSLIADASLKDEFILVSAGGFYGDGQVRLNTLTSSPNVMPASLINFEDKFARWRSWISCAMVSGLMSVIWSNGKLFYPIGCAKKC